MKKIDTVVDSQVDLFHHIQRCGGVFSIIEMALVTLKTNTRIAKEGIEPPQKMYELK
jgi:hypothetical protein